MDHPLIRPCTLAFGFTLTLSDLNPRPKQQPMEHAGFKHSQPDTQALKLTHTHMATHAHLMPDTRTL